MPKKHELYCANRLKMFRRRSEMTREDLVCESDNAVSVSTLHRWESNGIPANVNLKQLQCICDALRLSNGLEALEKVGNAYLKGLTLDIVQERLEAAAEDMKAREIIKIVEFIDKQEESDEESEEHKGGQTKGDLFGKKGKGN